MSPMNMEHRSDNKTDSLAPGFASSAASSTLSNRTKASRDVSTTAVLNSNSAKNSPDRVAKAPATGKTPGPFKFTWEKGWSHRSRSQHDARFANEPKGGSADIKAVPDSGATKVKSIPRRKLNRPKKLPGPKPPSPIQVAVSGAENALLMDNESGVNAVLSRRNANAGEEEEDYTEEEGDEEKSSTPGPKVKVEDLANPTSMNNIRRKNLTKLGLPFDPNGRFHGRKLVMWHRKYLRPCTIQPALPPSRV
jgi:hypothetical protein